MQGSNFNRGLEMAQRIFLKIPRKNGEWKLETHCNSVCIKRRFSYDPIREVFEPAKSGDAGLLTEVLRHMNVSERAAFRSLNSLKLTA